ncbi:MAG TPA: HDOD domain-containing protein [Turneriella sp.]|nr:HDOD domain-containing protein [Turneriella sp.]
MSSIIIPPLPTIVAQVIQFDANNPKNGAADLEKLVIPDKAISAELLRVANSAFYGRSGKVKILRDALAVLGIKATKNLVIYLSTKTMASTYKSEAFKKYLNRFPIYSALIAQGIAQETSIRAQADEAFLAALLHSIGMNIMALQNQGHFSDMLQACEKNKWDLLKLEKQSYGTTHIELGKKAALEWKLPDEFQPLMEISPSSDCASLVSPIEKVTFVASVCASLLLGIPVTETAKTGAQRCYNELGGTHNVLLRHAAPDTQVKIEAHPFTQLASV